MTMPKRTDNKGRILKDGEMQRKDGRYMFGTVDPITKERKFIYSWKLERHDPMPKGKKNDKSLREKIAELKSKTFVGVSIDGGSLTVLELVEKYIETRQDVRPSTKSGYKTVVNFLKQDPLGKTKISKVNAMEAKLWLIGLQKNGKSYSTIHTIRGVLRPAFQLAVESQFLFSNPFSFELKGVLINDQIKREAVSRKDEKRFLKFLKHDEHFSRYYDAIFILFNTGLRIGELCGLTVNDIDLENRTININHQLQYNSGYGKNIRSVKTESGERILPMSNDVYTAFCRVLENSKQNKCVETIDGYTDFLFCDDKGKVMVGYHWEKKFFYSVEKFNKTYKEELPKITPHMCRHTYATRMATSGVSVQTLKMLMGHSSVDVTLDIYTHIKLEDAKNELEKLELLKEVNGEEYLEPLYEELKPEDKIIRLFV